MAKNVLGGELLPCGQNPVTGFYRDGCCNTGPDDQGLHLVCTVVDDRFLAFSKSRGNDLSTPRHEYHFPGLKQGDRWCICVERWQEALHAGVAPAVILEATHISTLEFVDLDDLKSHALPTTDA